MGKSAPTPPPAPNPQTIIQSQAAANADTARLQAQLNNENYVGPQGSVYWSRNGDQWTQNVSLSGPEQNIFNAETNAEYGALNTANNQLQRVNQSLNYGLSAPSVQMDVPVSNMEQSYGSGGPLQYGYGSGGPVQSSIGPSSFGTAVQDAANAAYQQAASRLDPQWAQAQEQLQSQLTAQGLGPNSSAYQTAMDGFQRQKTDAYDQANFSAVQAGNQEQQALFGEQAAAGTFANQAQLQQNAENQQQAQFYDQAQAAAEAQAQARAGFYNSTAQQYFNDQLSNAQLYDQAAQQRFQDTAYSQELPVNQLSALLGLGQVSMPQSATGATAVSPTNVLGAYELQQQANQANYQARMPNLSSSLGGLFNLGSAVLSKLPW